MSSIKSWSITSLGVEHVSHTWTVENFSVLMDKSTYREISSPKFSNDSGDQQFCLKLDLSNWKDNYISSSFGSLNIRLVQLTNNLPIKIKTNIWMQGYSKHSVFSFTGLGDSLTKSINFKEFEDEKSKILIDDKIVINCAITFLKTREKKCTPNANLVKANNSKLAKEFGAALDAQELSDVMIVTGDDQKIPVHKIILSARSKVFAAMFKHPTKENSENCITISDISSVVVKEMLKYIYSGEAPKLKDMPVDLMAAADKYELDGLKAMCARFMSVNLSIETAPIVLKAADLHNVEDLKAEAIKFIQSNIYEVTNSSNWQDMIETDKKLILETFIDQRFINLKHNEGK